MIKCFLSHSSVDKGLYVETVARILSKENIIYDEYTFEEGMPPLEEILKGLGVSDIFVLFISNNSLESEWVQAEIVEAKELLDDGEIKRIFPVIIDKDIDYTDGRIPAWLRDGYNLKLINRPTVAARRIKQRMREVSWQLHPRLKERESLFVGRNEIISSVEERIDDFDKPKPFCIIASGIEGIGRKSLLKQSFKKGNIVGFSYEFPVISFSQHESLEDFILKIYDLGFSEEKDIKNLIGKTIEEKISISIDLINDVVNCKERILIIDDGCIVRFDRNIAGWFMLIIDGLENNDYILFAIASKFRLNRSVLRGVDTVFPIEVPELDVKERSGLLSRYCSFEKLNLSREDLRLFSELLNGFPEQVFYTVDLIRDVGIIEAKKRTYEIVEFSSERASRILKKYEDNDNVMDFISLIAHFDFISHDFICDIVNDDDFVENTLDDLITTSVCEVIGAGKEYIRMNDAIRDYVRRTTFKIPDNYRKRIEHHVGEFLKSYKEEEKDVSDYLFSLKEALLSGEKVDQSYLIPSHFLKTMKDLYDQYRRYDDVINLADRVLQSDRYLDETIKRNIRYYLCLSLARKRSDRFLREVQFINGSDHNFLFGFYCRLKGRYEDAIDRLNRALGERENFSSARRELVQVYSFIEDFESALSLAKRNYEENRLNPYHIQAYFNCLLKSSRPFENTKELEKLLDSFSKVDTDVSNEMYLRALSEFHAINKNDYKSAIEVINDCVAQFPDSVYSNLTKFDICERSSNISCMVEALGVLRGIIDKSSYFYNALLRAECLLLAHQGEKDRAENLLHRNLGDFPLTYRERIRQRISTIVG